MNGKDGTIRITIITRINIGNTDTITNNTKLPYPLIWRLDILASAKYLTAFINFKMTTHP